MKRSLSIIILITLVMSLCSCGKKDKPSEQDKNAITNYSFIMVIDKVNSKLVKEKFDIVNTDKRQQISELLEALHSYESAKYAAPLADDVLSDWTLVDNTLELSFKDSYNGYPRIEETLIRAAIVNTLCQLEYVNDISFIVNGGPLTIDNKVIGRMKAENFLMDMNLQNTTTNVTLYFPDSEKNILTKVIKSVPYNNTFTDEQLVIEALIMGPDEDKLSKSLPDGTKIVNIVTKDLVCYVNFSRDFLKYRDDVSDQMTIYSIVNSLCELSGIRSVVITVDGETVDYYQSVPINDMLTYNYDILEEQK